MNTRLLEYIIAISEEKSLSRAAERLLISQPALSQQLKRLEDELDAKLFYREKNRLLLTDAGKIYVNGARSALSIYEQALTEIKQLRRSSQSQITLVCARELLPGFSTEILSVFSGKHRDIFLDVIDGNSSIAKSYLAGGMADLAVMAAGELSHSILEYLPLRDEEMLLALPSAHSLTAFYRENGVDLSRLSGKPFILNRGGSFLHAFERQIFTAAQITPYVLCEADTMEAARHMVANKKGAAFLPRSMAQNADGCSFFSLNPPAVFHTVIAYHKSMVLTGPMRDLILLLLEVYGER